MTLKELQTAMTALIQQPVTFKRIAGNSIIIYFFGEPGDDSVVSVFIDPSWRYHLNGKVLVGSYDLLIEESDFNTKEEYEERFDYLCALTDAIKGAILVNFTIDPESSDLTMEFSGNQRLCNFANSGFDEKYWTYRNWPQQITAYVAPQGIKLEEGKG